MAITVSRPCSEHVFPSIWGPKSARLRGFPPSKLTFFHETPGVSAQNQGHIPVRELYPDGALDETKRGGLHGCRHLRIAKWVQITPIIIRVYDMVGLWRFMVFIWYVYDTFMVGLWRFMVSI